MKNAVKQINGLTQESEGNYHVSAYDVAAKVSEDVIDHMAEFIKQH